MCVYVLIVYCFVCVCCVPVRLGGVPICVFFSFLLVRRLLSCVLACAGAGAPIRIIGAAQQQRSAVIHLELFYLT